MSAYHYVLVVLSITLSTIFNGDIYLIEALNGGFSVELIHRDSPKSPLYNFSETQFERMTKAINHSLNRVEHFYPPEYCVNYRALQAPLTHRYGSYFMKLSIGTPSFDVMASLDTGSNLIWLQCQPCKKCYSQTNPIFDPSKSKTYEVASCSSNACKLIKDSNCKKISLKSQCQYKILYEDNKVSSGDVGYETFTFGINVKNSPARIDKIIFGCGHDNHGFFNPISAGIIGLGNGGVSLTSQLGAAINNKFSYCLALEHNIPSFLNFGEMVFGPGTVSTPLVSGSSSVFDYVNLKGMTVAGKRLDFLTLFGNTGKIILDTGSTFTFLPTNFYKKVESLVAAQIKLQPVTDKKLPEGLKLCYKSSVSELKAPPITVHFDGADIVLNQYNTFSSFDNSLLCFTFNIDDKISVFGNSAQFDFLVGIDRQKKIVSFKATQCGKL
ncbi:unnamed protein product [Lupinus luteus]|uniref:Peptidase A1 domain-containing protein n=1 Tax=Lupinus luteus TaxID=3873 RepID=A0AAV1VZL3_LUPLU